MDFEVGLQEVVIVSQMLAGKQQIGCAGDMPAIVGLSKRETRDLRIVATLGTAQDQCGVFLTRPDAPDFKDQAAAPRLVRRQDDLTPQGNAPTASTRRPSSSRASPPRTTSTRASR